MPINGLLTICRLYQIKEIIPIYENKGVAAVFTDCLNVDVFRWLEVVRKLGPSLCLHFVTRHYQVNFGMLSDAFAVTAPGAFRGQATVDGLLHKFTLVSVTLPL